MRGQVYRAGDLVLQAREQAQPGEPGLLASVGKAPVMVIPRPRVAIVPTGDELVDHRRFARARPDPQLERGDAPGAGDRREERRLSALPIAPDEPGELKRILEEGLDSDVLLITGGVSAGQRDLVPAALAELGVTRVFHKVRLKPGKPLWFGVGPARATAPGRSSSACRAIPSAGWSGSCCSSGRRCIDWQGGPSRCPSRSRSGLAATFTHRGDRPTYHPARWLERPRHASPGVVEPLPWAGSADLLAVARADGFAVFPAGDRVFQAGEIVRFLPLD